MPPFQFRSTAAIREDLDRPLLADIGPTKPPIFVLGLHRSGTTYLYQQLADHFPLAVTRLYHVTHYRRLLWARREGLEATYQAELAADLAERGLADRGIDGFPVSPTMLEEYAFILRKFSRAWGFTPANAELFDEVLRKLSALDPDAPALLLKNPLDLAAAVELAERYPSARFVFIRRDPVRVLNSQFRNSFLYRKRPEPFLDLLLAGIPAWRFAFHAVAAANHVIPDGLYQAMLVRALRGSIRGQLERHYRMLPALDPARYVEVSYERLLAAPEETLAAIERLIGVPRRPEVAAMAASPRLEPLLPAVAAVAEDFRRELAHLPDAALRADDPSTSREALPAV